MKSLIGSIPVDHRPWSGRRAFTLVELLVVIGVVVILIGLLLAGLARAYRYARESQTSRVMQNIGSAIETFRTDFNYLPPLLVDPMFDPIAATATSPRNFRVPEAMVGPGLPFSSLDDILVATSTRTIPFRFHSEYTIATYLIGLGDTDGSSFDTDMSNDGDDIDDGAPGPGIRAPGPDHSWGGGMDRQMQSAKRAKSQAGRVYGPYLDVASLGKSLERDPTTGLFRILDVWGHPIRYYKGWYTRSAADPSQPSVGRVPVELRTARGVEFQFNSGGMVDFTLEQSVLAAPYMLLSAGSDPAEECDPDPASDMGFVPVRPRFGDFQDCSPVQPRLDRDLDPGQFPSDLERLLRDLQTNLRYTP